MTERMTENFGRLPGGPDQCGRPKTPPVDRSESGGGLRQSEIREINGLLSDFGSRPYIEQGNGKNARQRGLETRNSNVREPIAFQVVEKLRAHHGPDGPRFAHPGGRIGDRFHFSGRLAGSDDAADFGEQAEFAFRGHSEPHRLFEGSDPGGKAGYRLFDDPDRNVDFSPGGKVYDPDADAFARCGERECRLRGFGSKVDDRVEPVAKGFHKGKG